MISGDRNNPCAGGDRARVVAVTPLKHQQMCSAPSFPTRISRSKALRLAPADALKWLVNNNILAVLADRGYGLVDEFLRIRMRLDEEEEEAPEVEAYLLNHASFHQLPSVDGYAPILEAEEVEGAQDELGSDTYPPDAPRE